MSNKAEFHGIYTAFITPLTPSHELNEEAFRKVVEFNIQSGINGFWVAGGSGESVLLGDDENSRMAKIVTEQTDGRAKIIMSFQLKYYVDSDWGKVKEFHLKTRGKHPFCKKKLFDWQFLGFGNENNQIQSIL